MVDAIFKEIGYKVNQLANTYEYNSDNRKDTLIEIAFDAYLMFYFFDNLTFFIENYCQPNEEYEPLKIIEFLLENDGINHFDYNRMYNGLTGMTKVEVEKESKEILSIRNKNENKVLTILTNEQWSCAGCTYLNEPDKTTCALCNSAKNLPNATFY